MRDEPTGLKQYVVAPDAEISDIDLDEEVVLLRDGPRLTEARAAAWVKKLRPGASVRTGDARSSSGWLCASSA